MAVAKRCFEFFLGERLPLPPFNPSLTSLYLNFTSLPLFHLFSTSLEPLSVATPANPRGQRRLDFAHILGGETFLEKCW